MRDRKMTYQNLASLYDRLMEHAPYDQWFDFTKEMINKSNINVRSIADLGCGTGEITIKLAQAGYKLYGIDYSAEMLAHASAKSFQQGVNITWLKQDLRSLEGLSNIDLALSYCDVINYLPEKRDLLTAFGHVYKLLKEGGLFVFDVHSIDHVQKNLVNQTFADVGEDYSYIWFCEAGESHGEMFHDLTFYMLDGDHYIRFDEFHHQKTYPVEVYQQLLEESGFENIEMYADFSLKRCKSLENCERIFFLAKKAG